MQSISSLMTIYNRALLKQFKQIQYEINTFVEHIYRKEHTHLELC